MVEVKVGQESWKGEMTNLKRTYKTLDEIAKEKSLSNEEREWMDKMVSMCMTLRKHHRLTESLIKNSN